MYCKKHNPILVLLWNTVIVAVVFMAIDYVYYVFIAPQVNPYHADLTGKIIHTILFALPFAYLYDRTSRMWRPNFNNNDNKDGFINSPNVVLEADLCKVSLLKIINGIIFSLLISAVVIMAMFLAKYVAANVFIYLLDGIRGVPEDSGDTVVLVTKIVVSSVALECTGKTESDPPREG